MIKKTFWIVLPFIVVILALSAWLIFETPSGEAYHIDGDNVWWDNSYGKLVVFPHTSNQLITHTQYANLTSYIPVSTNLDFAFEFNEPLKKKQIWVWKNISHQKWSLDYLNYTYLKTAGNNTCEYWGCFDQETLCNCTRMQQNGMHLEDNYYFDWKDITNNFQHSEWNNSHFYWIKNVNFDTDETKQIKWKYDQPVKTTGKWGLWIKRSQDTIPEALENGMFIHLDPWWSADWKQKVNISVEETGGIARLNEMADVWLNYTVSNCTKEYRILWNDTLELTSQIYNETYFGEFCTSANALFMVNLTANQHRNYTLYFNNSGATAPSYTDLVVSYDPNWIEQIQTPIYNVTDADSGTQSTKRINFMNLSTSTLNGMSFYVSYIYGIADQRFNKSIKRDGVLMIESHTTTNSISNATVRIYPYYSEINFESNASHTQTVSIHTRTGLPTSGDDNVGGADYSFFGNATLMDTTGINANKIWVNEEPIASGSNKTYVYAFFNVSQEGFIMAFSNITSYYVMEEDDIGRFDGFILGMGNAPVYAKIVPTSYKLRFAMDRNFSDAGWQVARNERIKLDYPLTYSYGDFGKEEVGAEAGFTHNITENNYESITYETSITNFNATVWINYSMLDFIDADLIWDGENLGTDSNITSKGEGGTNKTFYEKNHTSDLVDINATSYSFYWNLTIYYLNGSIGTDASASNNQEVQWAYSFPSVIADKIIVFEWDNIQANGTISKKADNAITSMKFDLNNANHTATQISNIPTEERYSAVIPVGSISSNTLNLTLFGWINISFAGITKERIAISNYTINISKVSVDNCSINSEVIINYFLRDEETKQQNLYNQSIEVDVNLTSASNNLINWRYSVTALNQSNLSICATTGFLDSDNILYAVAKYSSEDHVIEYNHINNHILNGIIQNISLHDLATEDSTSFLVQFQDGSYLAVSGAIIDVWRYYVGDGEYLSVEHGKTDDNGQTRLHLVTEDIRYKFYVRKDGELLWVSPEYLALCQATPCQINLQQKSDINPIGNYSTTENLAYTITLDKSARTVTLEFATKNGASTSMKMNVTTYDARLNETICAESGSSSGGTLLCTIPQTAKNTTYLVNIYKDGEFVTYRFFSLSEGAFVTFGTTGILLTIFLYLTLVLIAISSGAGIIIFGILGLVLAMALNLFDGGSTLGVGSAILWLIVAGVIILIKISNKRVG